MAGSVDEAAVLDDGVVLFLVLLVEVLVELVVSDDGFSPEQPTPAIPMTIAVPAAPITAGFLTPPHLRR